MLIKGEPSALATMSANFRAGQIYELQMDPPTVSGFSLE